MERWPQDLPQRVLAEGYQESLGEGRLSTPMDVGPPKSRRRFSHVPDPVTASFRCTLDQKERLKRFWRDDLAGGSRLFILPDPSLNGVPLLTDEGEPLLDNEGTPLLIESWLIVMGEAAPSFRPIQRGMRWVASLPLVIMP